MVGRGASSGLGTRRTKTVIYLPTTRPRADSCVFRMRASGTRASTGTTGTKTTGIRTTGIRTTGIRTTDTAASGIGRTSSACRVSGRLNVGVPSCCRRQNNGLHKLVHTLTIICVRLFASCERDLNLLYNGVSLIFGCEQQTIYSISAQKDDDDCSMHTHRESERDLRTTACPLPPLMQSYPPII